MKTLRTALALVFIVAVSPIVSAQEEKQSESTRAPELDPVRFDPVERNLEGWTVYVEPALLEGEHKKEGAKMRMRFMFRRGPGLLLRFGFRLALGPWWVGEGFPS